MVGLLDQFKGFPMRAAKRGHIHQQHQPQRSRSTIHSDQPGSLTSGGVATYSGVISGTGTSGIVKAGTGHVYFTGSNSYTGITRVNNGTLTLEDIGAAPGRNTPGMIIVAGGATLGINAGTYAGTSVDTLRDNVT